MSLMLLLLLALLAAHSFTAMNDRTEEALGTAPGGSQGWTEGWTKGWVRSPPLGLAPPPWLLGFRGCCESDYPPPTYDVR